MLIWAVLFFLLTLITGGFGFGVVSGAGAGVARVLFFVFLILLLLSAIVYAMRGRPPL